MTKEREKKTAEATFHDRVIDDLVSYIELHLEEKLSIDILSQIAGYSSWHLQRFFKKQTGFTIGEYIRNRRLANSALILLGTKLSVKEVAEKYSFDSLQTFNKSFKQRFGMPPTEYRLQNELSMSTIMHPFKRANDCGVYVLEVIELNEQIIFGDDFELKIDVNELLNGDSLLNREQLYHLLNVKDQTHENVIILSSIFSPYVAPRENDSFLNMTITLKGDFVKKEVSTKIIPAGTYLNINGQFTLRQYNNCLSKTYRETLLAMDLKKRNESEIERFRIQDKEQGIYEISMLLPVAKADPPRKT